MPNSSEILKCTSDCTQPKFGAGNNAGATRQERPKKASNIWRPFKSMN